MNELNTGLAISQNIRHESYSAAKSAATLPHSQVETVSSGKELPSPVNSSSVHNLVDSKGVAASELREVDARQTESVVEDLNKAAISLQRDLSFKVDDDTGKSIITVTDSLTQKVIRQIPSEEIVELAKNLQSMMQSAAIPTGSTQVDVSGGSLLNVIA